MNAEVTTSLSEKWPFHSQYLFIFYDIRRNLREL